MRIPAGLTLLLLLGSFASKGLYRNLPVPERPWVRFTPLDASELAGCKLDGMRFEAGWALTSNHPRFGGISGLHVEGGRAIVVTDAGESAIFPLVAAGRVPLAMHALDDLRLPKKERDAESLVVAGESAWVGFEKRNMIRRYRLTDWSAIAEVRPVAMRGWSRKQGAETLARLSDGRFLAIAEGSGEALLFNGDPTAGGEPRRLEYRPPEGFKPVDAVQLADGRMLIVNRRYRITEGPTGFATSLTLAALPALEGREIARLERPCIHDNFEAVSVTHDNGRETVWLASDDNFGPLQRTLLLKLSLRP